MHLVDEEDIAPPEACEDSGQIARSIEERPRRCVNLHIELVGDDMCEGRFSESGRAVEKDVIERLATLIGRLYGDTQLLFDFTLTEHLVELLGPQGLV